MRKKLRDCSVATRELETAVERWLASHSAARTIAVFAALPGEPDLSGIVSRQVERRWVYPRVIGDELFFHQPLDLASDLTPGKFGILEPSAALPLAELWEIDAFFCPGLAFDSCGGRLGRGRGFYDRMLARARPDALKIGICHACQIVPDTFCQAHDVRMDEVIHDSLPRQR